jgi:hypothetical protein
LWAVRAKPLEKIISNIRSNIVHTMAMKWSGDAIVQFYVVLSGCRAFVCEIIWRTGKTRRYVQKGGTKPMVKNTFYWWCTNVFEHFADKWMIFSCVKLPKQHLKLKKSKDTGCYKEIGEEAEC